VSTQLQAKTFQRQNGNHFAAEEGGGQVPGCDMVSSTPNNQGSKTPGSGPGYPQTVRHPQAVKVAKVSRIRPSLDNVQFGQALLQVFVCPYNLSALLSQCNLEDLDFIQVIEIAPVSIGWHSA
jgi:hypothetical protein